MDDTEIVLEAVVAVLQNANYRVLPADSGPNAITLADQTEGVIDLLLSDVDMPKMSGPNLGKILQASQQIYVGDRPVRSPGSWFLRHAFYH